MEKKKIKDTPKPAKFVRKRIVHTKVNIDDFYKDELQKTYQEESPKPVGLTNEQKKKNLIREQQRARRLKKMSNDPAYAEKMHKKMEEFTAQIFSGKRNKY